MEPCWRFVYFFAYTCIFCYKLLVTLTWFKHAILRKSHPPLGKVFPRKSLYLYHVHDLQPVLEERNHVLRKKRHFFVDLIQRHRPYYYTQDGKQVQKRISLYPVPQRAHIAADAAGFQKKRFSEQYANPLAFNFHTRDIRQRLIDSSNSPRWMHSG